MKKARVAVLISGRGSNLGALIRATLDPQFPVNIVQVISNLPNVGGLEIARENDIPYSVIDQSQYDSRADHEAAIHECLVACKAEIVCLAGYMRILGDDFVQNWRGKMINIHPSLLPTFKGIDTHERAIEAGMRIHGCTVHFVSPDLDGGPIISQAACPVYPNDDAQKLADRVLELEHDLYPKALKLVADGSIRWSGGVGVTTGDVDHADIIKMSGVD